MRIVAIDHVQLAMPGGEEERARRFYRDLLGIPEIPKPPELAKRGGAWFESPPLKIHLGVEKDFRPAKKAHPALLVEDLPRLIVRLRAAGLEVTDEPIEGFLRVYVHDPFGNRLELMEALH
jgi:catechol 2,3-dioxygenase-like lactoylglutathione lyase family enzyme